MKEKTLLRDQLKEKRKVTFRENGPKASLQIYENVQRLPDFQNAELLLSYRNFGSEVMTQAFESFSSRKQIAYPKTHGEDMDFYLFHPDMTFELSSFQVPEPVDTPKVCLQDYSSICMLVPGLGFSLDGYRIGYGKGFYDRYLSSHSGIITIGLAFDEQIVEGLPIEAHDKALDYVITPSKIYRRTEE